jgi:hypothetical protein
MSYWLGKLNVEDVLLGRVHQAKSASPIWLT